MNRLIKWTVLLLLVTLPILPTAAQEATPEIEPEPITLVPHTNEAFGIETVVPHGWTNAGNGIFARSTSPADLAVIAQQAAPLPAGALLNAILPQLLLTEAPESVGTHQGTALEWTLYQVDVPAGNLTLRVDLALAEAGGKTYLVLVQSLPEDYDALHTGVFLLTLDAFAPLVEATAEPVPYTIEDVTFENGDITLAGTLTLPPTEGAHPVVVLVSGSGPQDRDESLGAGVAIKPFRLLADALTREGIAVLRFDDRGVGESTGDFAAATTADFASDAEAAIAFLLTRDDINPDQIGLIGHSEGGLVAAMLGASSDDLAFIVSLAGPGVNGREVLLLQNRRLMEAEGAPEEEIVKQVAFVESLFPHLGDAEAIEQIMYEYTLQQIAALPEDQRALIGDVETYARTLAAQAAQQYGAAWFESFINYDPAPDWAQTTIPVLAFFGGKDVQVDAEQNAPALQAALEAAGNEDFEIVVLPDANHLFQAAGTGGLSEYGTLPAEFTPDFLPTLVNWLLARVTVVE